MTLLKWCVIKLSPKDCILINNLSVQEEKEIEKIEELTIHYGQSLKTFIFFFPLRFPYRHH